MQRVHELTVEQRDGLVNTTVSSRATAARRAAAHREVIRLTAELDQTQAQNRDLVQAVQAFKDLDRPDLEQAIRDHHAAAVGGDWCADDRLWATLGLAAPRDLAA
jgi:hypothetical protein